MSQHLFLDVEVAEVEFLGEFGRPADVGDVESPLLSLRRRILSRLSQAIWPSWYLVAGLSSIRSVAGIASRGMRRSRASDASQVSTRTSVSQEIKFASVEQL